MQTKSVTSQMLNEKLVNRLISLGIIKSERMKQVMLSVDRSKFVPDKLKSSAFEDCPLPIGANVTISAPHMHAYALQELEDKLKERNKVLDIGSGSGILCSAFIKAMNYKGLVVGVEHIEQLAERSLSSIKSDNSEAIDAKLLTVQKISASEMESLDLSTLQVDTDKMGKILLIVGDGRKGCEALGPFDCIHVGAAVGKEYVAILDSLAIDGRMMAPIEDESGQQRIIYFDKSKDGTIAQTPSVAVGYVPLTSKEAQLNRFGISTRDDL